MKVLITDDHEIVRDGLALLIQDHYQVEGIYFATEGREAIQLSLQFPFDLVLLDLSMPHGLDGLQASVELRKQLPDAKIVIFSMYGEEAYQRKAYEIGLDGYLVKRLKGSEIIQSLNMVLAGQKVFSNQMVQSASEAANRQHPWELPISQREKEVFTLTIMGHSQKEIAEILAISPKTVENHRRNISNKLGTNKKSDWFELGKKYNLQNFY
ncbi:response regulator [Brevibacillus ginsengisoli]|uniref:response regulator n=1 Tax=Brevibacillus ginsengisoli TaxID=363854 RepID=UPI003CED79B9